MTLDDVQLRDPHPEAHNAERHAINALQGLTDTTFLSNLEEVFVTKEGLVDGDLIDALSDTFVQVSGPSDITLARGDGAYWDPRHSTYVPPGASHALRKTRAKMGGVAAGVANARAKIAIMGHSHVSGYGSTVGSNDLAVCLRKILNRRYPMGSGLVTAFNNNGGDSANPQSDSRWNLSANWKYAGGTWGSGDIQLHMRCQTSGTPATFTSDVAGTIVEIYTFGNGSAVTYAIDSGSNINITPNGTMGVQVTTVTGQTNATHTVRVNSTSSSSAFLLGVSVRPAIALEVSAFGFYGSEASDWLPSTQWYDGYKDVVSYAPDLVIIQLDANEAIHGKTPETLRSNLQTIVTALKAVADVAIVTSAAPNVTAETWTTFRQAVYQVATDSQIPLVDFRDRLGSNVTATANGIMYDPNHPNGAGYMDSALALSALLGEP